MIVNKNKYSELLEVIKMVFIIQQILKLYLTLATRFYEVLA